MTSDITIITPTCDRHFGFPFLEEFVRSQTVQPTEWIVADGGHTPPPLTMGQKLLSSPGPAGAQNLANNLARALGHATGTYIFIFEDDDFYFPDHIETGLKYLTQGARATGSNRLEYYNLQQRQYIQLMNKGSALCQTSFHRDLIPLMLSVVQHCAKEKNYGIDGRFWSVNGQKAHTARTVIGMKGLPGTTGLGIGHRPGTRPGWIRDPNLDKLKEWVGEAWMSRYLAAYETAIRLD